jgi:ATP-dependent Clp protease ATP-binding subunit ClpC
MLFDAAGAHVKLRNGEVPAEISEAQKRVRLLVHRIEDAIAHHEFQKARSYSDEEQKECENLRTLRAKHQLPETGTGVVGREDVAHVISQWTRLPVASLREEGPREETPGDKS